MNCVTIDLKWVPLLNPSKVDLYDNKTWDSYFVVGNYSGLEFRDPHARE